MRDPDGGVSGRTPPYDLLSLAGIFGKDGLVSGSSSYTGAGLCAPGDAASRRGRAVGLRSLPGTAGGRAALCGGAATAACGAGLNPPGRGADAARPAAAGCRAPRTGSRDPGRAAALRSGAVAVLLPWPWPWRVSGSRDGPGRAGADWAAGWAVVVSGLSEATWAQ
jgi:hypothetical protein